MHFEMFRITVNYFFLDNLASNIEINVFLNQRPVCLLYQTKCGFYVMDPGNNTVLKHFDLIYRSVARLLLQSVKSRKLTSNLWQVTVFVQFR